MVRQDKQVSGCTCSAFRMVSRHISRLYDQALAPTGLRSGQFLLLRALSRLGPLGVQDLADYMMLERTTAGRNLRPLERDGLVSIAIDPSDRRGRLLELTDPGRTLLLSAEPLWAVAQERLETRFGAEATWTLHSMFAALLRLDLTA